MVEKWPNKIFSENHEELTSTLNDLGDLYLIKQDYKKAEEIFNRVLKIDKNHCLNSINDKATNTKKDISK